LEGGRGKAARIDVSGVTGEEAAGAEESVTDWQEADAVEAWIVGEGAVSEKLCQIAVDPLRRRHGRAEETGM
jgi:hypothetical protein